MNRLASKLEAGQIILRHGVRCEIVSVSVVSSPIPSFIGNVMRIEHKPRNGASKQNGIVHFTRNQSIPCES